MASNSAGAAYRPPTAGSEWLRSAVAAVRNRWIVLLVGAVLGGALGAILTTTQTPSYESSAVIYQTPHFGDTDGMSRQRTDAYTSLLTSDLVIETALDDTGLEMSFSEVREKTTASANIGSAILTVTVRAEDAETSAQLANALAQALPGTVATLDGTTSAPDPAVLPETPAVLPETVAVLPETVATEPVRLAVISPAVADDAEGGPKYVRNTALGVIAGLLVGLLYAYLRTQVNRRVQDAGTLAKFLSGPVLACIPAAKALESGLVDFMKDSPAAEAFRRLRTLITDHEPGRGTCRTIVVSSAIDGDGKTAVAVNLAVSLAESGNEVVYVDASTTDPDGPDRHRTTPGDGLTATGLSGYLLGDGDIGRYVSASWHPKLSLVSGGPAVDGRSDLLGSARMREGLADLGGRADYLIVDTASLGARSDALVLGRCADGVLLVARSDHTRYAEVGAAIERLSLADVRVSGVVLNDFPRPLFRSRGNRRARLSATRLLAPEARSIDSPV